jgi:hypothetical protein
MKWQFNGDRNPASRFHLGDRVRVRRGTHRLGGSVGSVVCEPRMYPVLRVHVKFDQRRAVDQIPVRCLAREIRPPSHRP